MNNYKIVHQWATTIKADKALNEMKSLKLKYPWMKCDETISFLEHLNSDLPKILQVVKLQEKQNMMHRHYIHVNGLADEAIAKAIAAKYNIDL